MPRIIIHRLKHNFKLANGSLVNCVVNAFFYFLTFLSTVYTKTEVTLESTLVDAYHQNAIKPNDITACRKFPNKSVISPSKNTIFILQSSILKFPVKAISLENYESNGQNIGIYFYEAEAPTELIC